jgi:20S proteasome subunit beta 4
MDCAIGLVGKDFVMFMTDMTVARSIVAFKHDEDKIKRLDKTKLLATAGDHASRTAFAEYIEKNMALMRLRTDLEMSNDACAHFIRRQIAKSLRSRDAVQCNSLLGGVDKDGPALYFLDYLGSLQKLDFAAHGYCSNFTLSVLDKQFRQNLSKDEAMTIMGACVKQLSNRFLINLPKFLVKTVTADGEVEESILVMNSDGEVKVATL